MTTDAPTPPVPVTRRTATRALMTALGATGVVAAARAGSGPPPVATHGPGVDDYSALRALPPGRHPSVFVQRYSAHREDYGAAGVFRWEAGAAEPDDDGTIIAPSAGGTGRWKRVFEEFVNVKWFGARGDDAPGFDDAVPMQRAIDVAGLKLDVYVPFGVYRIRQTLTWANLSIGRSLFGVHRAVAPNASTINVDPDLPLPLAAAIATGTAALQIRDLEVTCNGRARHGIVATKMSGPFVEWHNVAVDGALLDCFHLDMCQVAVFRRLRATGFGRNGFRFIDCNGSRAEALYTDAAAATAEFSVHIEGVVNSGGMTLVGADLEGDAGGVRIVNTQSPTRVRDTWIEIAAGRDGVLIEDAAWVRIADNRISGGGADLGARAVRIVNGTGCAVSGNTAHFGSQNDAHITVTGTSSNNRIRDNHFLSTSVMRPLLVEDNGQRNEYRTALRSEAAAPPTTGTWLIGDVVWNSAPQNPSAPLGWVYTTVGTAQRWVPIGRPAPAPAVAPVGSGAGVFAVDDADVFMVGPGQRYRLNGGYDGKRVTLVATATVDLQHMLTAIGNIHLTGAIAYSMRAGATITLMRVTLAAWPDGNPQLTRWREVAR